MENEKRMSYTTALGLACIIVTISAHVVRKNGSYDSFYHDPPKYTIKHYILEYNRNTYIDELEKEEKTSKLIEEMYRLEECIQIIELLKPVDLKGYDLYMPLTEEEENELKEITYEEIVILKETYESQKSTIYEEQRQKELIARRLAYFKYKSELFVREEGQRIAIQFGKILLQSSVAQTLKDNPAYYESYILSFDEDVVEYQDEVLGDITIILKQDSTFSKVREQLSLLKRGLVDYDTIKEAIVFYKYAIVSNPIYKNGIIEDEESWNTIRKLLSQ